MTDNWCIAFHTFQPPLGVRAIVSPVPAADTAIDIKEALEAVSGIKYVADYLGGTFDVIRVDNMHDPAVTNDAIKAVILRVLGISEPVHTPRIKVVQHEREAGTWVIQTTQRHSDPVLLAKLERAGLITPKPTDGNFNITCKFGGEADELLAVAEEVITAFGDPPLSLEAEISVQSVEANEFRVVTNRHFDTTDQKHLHDNLMADDNLGLCSVSFVGQHHDLLCKVANDLFNRMVVAEHVVQRIRELFGDKTK